MHMQTNKTIYPQCRADTRFASSQWETALLCNGVPHWMGASLESVLTVYFTFEFCWRHIGLFYSPNNALNHCNQICRIWQYTDSQECRTVVNVNFTTKCWNPTHIHKNIYRRKETVFLITFNDVFYVSSRVGLRHFSDHQFHYTRIDKIDFISYLKLLLPRNMHRISDYIVDAL